MKLRKSLKRLRARRKAWDGLSETKKQGTKRPGSMSGQK